MVSFVWMRANERHPSLFLLENEMKSEKGTGLLSWQGLAQDMSRGTRNAAIGLLALLSCAMVATQTNYFVLGNAHVIAVLAPIASCALLYGPMPATLVGFLAGLTELLHARLLPLDVYEAYFATPVNSVVLFALIGLVMGICYAYASTRTYDKPWKGYVALVLGCITGSTLFTLFFSASVNAINALLHLEVPHEILSDFTNNGELLSQIVANAFLMSALALVGARSSYHRQQTKDEQTLRETFQGWLAVVMAAAYLVSASLGYTAVSAACRTAAEQQMQSQIDYLLGQLSERDKMLEGIQRRTALSDARVQELHQSTVGNVATGLTLGKRGVTAIAENDVIVSSNVASYVGQSFRETVGSGLLNGFDEELFERSHSTQWYMGGELGYLRAAEMGYVRVSQVGTYQVMAALPLSEVYTWRPWMMAAVSLTFIILFAAMYVQASLLLKNVVVRKIDETNQTLSAITKGDLNQEVHVNEPIEFARLSSGINATVGSLKNAIAAESARIERDLATAKAIQESALPRTFPPFPQIEDFDIYASMTPAREVGGDFYDLFLVDDHTLAFLIADVSGKGIPASLFMMAAKIEIANNVQAGMDLPVALQTANWHLCQGNDAGMFVTTWAGMLDYETGTLTYVNAGHNPPLLRHNGRWRWLEERHGLFLGSFDSAKYRSSTITLERGDELLLYTDGVNEAFSASGEQYGNDRLERFLQQHATLHPHALSDALRTDISHWEAGAEQSDDITILTLEYGVPPEASGTLTVPATIAHLDDVLGLIHGELAQRHCPITTQNQLDIALEELFVNVCSYAYADQEEDGACRIDYIYNADPHAITVSITDWGVPFNPLDHKDPNAPSSIAEAAIGGLGILMVKRLTDDISYLRDDNANVVVFRKSW